MKAIKKLTLAVLTALAPALLFITPITLAGDHRPKHDHGPRTIDFQKCFVADAGPFGGHFDGTVAGDCGTGTVAFVYLSILPGTPIVRFAGEYTLTTQECTIKTVCGGTVNTRTGRIALNGVVTDGPLLGDRVQVRAQLNAAGTCSSGRLFITPNEQD